MECCESLIAVDAVDAVKDIIRVSKRVNCVSDHRILLQAKTTKKIHYKSQR